MLLPKVRPKLRPALYTCIAAQQTMNTESMCKSSATACAHCQLLCCCVTHTYATNSAQLLLQACHQLPPINLYLRNASAASSACTYSCTPHAVNCPAAQTHHSSPFSVLAST
jgi:hypothetical protein